MNTDDPSAAPMHPGLTRFSIATMLILVAAMAIVIAIGLELSKSRVSSYLLLRRSMTDAGWPPEWSAEMSKEQYDEFFRTQVELMRSHPLLTRVAQNPAIGGGTSGRSNAELIAWLRQNLKFERPSDGELLRISLTGRDPAQAATIVNAVVNTYFKEVVEQVYLERIKAEQSLERLYQNLSEQMIREKKDNAHLAKALGDDAKNSIELEMRLKNEHRSEENLDAVVRQLQLLRMKKSMPSRVQRLDEASAVP